MFRPRKERIRPLVAGSGRDWYVIQAWTGRPAQGGEWAPRRHGASYGRCAPGAQSRVCFRGME